MRKPATPATPADALREADTAADALAAIASLSVLEARLAILDAFERDGSTDAAADAAFAGRYSDAIALLGF
jgi:hypothetical protein